MPGTLLSFSIEMRHSTDCIACGVPIVMSAAIERSLRDSHQTFYCINGHPQLWPGGDRNRRGDRSMAR
jgi:hypothetical protein